MKFALWYGAFLILSLLEVSVLPKFFGAAVPSLAVIPLFLGVANQGFWPGLWLSGLAGVSRDILAPSSAATHTLFFLLIFFAMRFFLAFGHWDESIRRIGAVLAGIVAVPLAWLLSAWAGGVLAGMPTPLPGWPDFLSRAAARETAFALTWFLVFAGGAIRWFKKKQGFRLSRV